MDAGRNRHLEVIQGLMAINLSKLSLYFGQIRGSRIDRQDWKVFLVHIQNSQQVGV
jgi:hypothetical protein